MTETAQSPNGAGQDRGSADAGARVAYLPDIVIGGSPRSGTTFLCALLSKHPDVYVAQPVIPEPKVLLTEHPDGDAGYLERYHSFFSSAPAHAVCVEKTSNYFENEDARSRFARVLPDAKILFILRDPIARAHSNWRWSGKNGLETLTFDEALAAEGKRVSPFGPERAHVRPFDYLARSCYGSLAKAWVESLGSDRIGFFTLESAIKEPDDFVLRLQDFIGVTNLPWSMLETGVFNATEPAADISAETVAMMRARLAPEMRLLSKYSDINVAQWGF